ncbi:MAG: polysaccharide biosynthesis C-terminal domain-containing protein [Bacteroidota bacterium]
MLKKIASTFIIKVLIAILNLAIVIVLSRHIGASGKGEASLIVTTIAMILIFCNMIGGSSLVYFVPRYNIFVLFIISNLWSIIICAISYFIFKSFAIIPASFIVPVVLLSLINSFLETNLTILLGKEKINSSNYIALLKTTINFTILWLLIKSYDQVNIDAYIYSLYASMGLGLIVSTILILPYLKTVSFTGIKPLCYELFKLGFLNQAAHVMNFISFRFSYFLLVKYSGESVLGVYSNGISLTESLLLITNSFATILYPKISNSTDTESSQSITLKMTKMSTLICILALIPLLLLPSSFWIWLFGNDFGGVKQVIYIIAPGILFYNIILIIGHYFSGTGNYKMNTMANFIGLIITVTASILLIPTYGILQAGIISTCSYLGIAIFVMISFAKESKIKMHHLFPTFRDFNWLINQVKGMLKQ